MRKELINHLVEQAIRNEKIVLLTGDLGYKVLEDFQRRLPDRFFNLGIAEQSLMSIAAGMAKKGLRPIVYSIGNFPTMRCLEQIRNDVVFMQLPVTIVALGAGFSYGTSGYSHYLIEDFSALSAFDLDIYSPDGPNSAKLALDKILKISRPAYLRIGRGHETDSLFAIQPLQTDEFNIPTSTNVVFLSFGPIAGEVDSAVHALKAAEVNAINISVVDLPSLKVIIEKVTVHKLPIITVEEHVLRGGFGSLVIELSDRENQRIMRIGIEAFKRDMIGTQQFMRKLYGLDAKSIAEKAINFLSNGNHSSARSD